MKWASPKRALNLSNLSRQSTKEHFVFLICKKVENKLGNIAQIFIESGYF
jgi:hypothetical protein